MTWTKTCYLLKYGIQCFVLGQKKPLVAGIAVTDICNLACKHCVLNNKGQGHNSFAAIQKWMQDFYRKGARILYLQGGEPLLWQDGEKNINSIIDEARNIGFFRIAVATNGTLPLDLHADMIWVSIDGLPTTHNRIREKDIFETILNHVTLSSHPAIYANMTVNQINKNEVKEVIQFIAQHKCFSGISINFHTPYEGVEDLFVPLEERREIVGEIQKMKKQGYPVLNSHAALERFQDNQYKRPVYMIEMIDHQVLYTCCFGKDEKVCEKCGYGIIAEKSSVMHWNLKSIGHALRFFR